MPERPHGRAGGPLDRRARLLLASGSPQRRAILEQVGIPFDVVVSGAPELESGPPEELALENAFRKARRVADGPDVSGRRVLGVDTVVALGARAYGKPRDAEHARATLERLSGHTHRVISGVCVIVGDRVMTAAAATEVTFRRLDGATLDWYLATGEWRDRAGGYAIQARGAALVSQIAGDYLNVVGLPVATLLDLLPDLLQSSLRD